MTSYIDDLFYFIIIWDHFSYTIYKSLDKATWRHHLEQGSAGREFSRILGSRRLGRGLGRRRGRQISKIIRTSEDEEGEDVDVLRRPDLEMSHDQEHFAQKPPQ